MANLKVRVFKDEELETTVTIPSSVLRIASRLIPGKAATSLQEKGINLEELAALTRDPEARGTLIEVEEHKDNERVVISLE